LADKVSQKLLQLAKQKNWNIVERQPEIQATQLLLQKLLNKN
jgi:hypothetical protein